MELRFLIFQINFAGNCDEKRYSKKWQQKPTITILVINRGVPKGLEGVSTAKSLKWIRTEPLRQKALCTRVMKVQCEYPTGRGRKRVSIWPAVFIVPSMVTVVPIFSASHD